MILRLIDLFIDLNKYISNSLIKIYPYFFKEESPRDDYQRLLLQIIDNSQKPVMAILEIGGADRPSLKKNPKYILAGLDIEKTATADNIYDRFLHQSAAQPLSVKFDLIISAFLLEHIPDNRESLKSIIEGLSENGKMLHCFSCKYHPFNYLTKITNHDTQLKLIKHLRPESKIGYKSYYDLCQKSQIAKYIETLGCKIIQVKPYWVGNDYFVYFFPAFILITVFNKICKLFGISLFASTLILYAEKQHPNQTDSQPK